MNKKVVMSDRMAIVETKLDYLTLGQEGISKDLKSFIDAADKKYATKSEVYEIKSQVNKNSNKLWDTALKLAYALGIIAAIFMAANGGV